MATASSKDTKVNRQIDNRAYSKNSTISHVQEVRITHPLVKLFSTFGSSSSNSMGLLMYGRKNELFLVTVLSVRLAVTMDL